MCGLAGAWWRDEPHDAENRVAAAVRSLAHRGPDGQGSLLRREAFGTLAIGHSRLAILDLSRRGLQPMWSRCGRYALVYNGEVYNYLELRAELEALGVELRSGTDTEVLLEAWALWGRDCLPRLTGMYAFCIYDAQGHMLTLVRDPFGMKPLYFEHTEGSLFFASEIGALLQLRPGRPELDVQRSYDFLAHGDYDTSDACFIRGVSHLTQGTAVTLDLTTGRMSEPMRWWTPQFKDEAPLSWPQAVEAVREGFLKNVRQHLRSDVPVGVALSGGIDSSAVVCAMRHVDPNMPIHTFSYVAEDPRLSEESWVAMVNDRVGGIGTTVRASHTGMAEDLDEVISCQGEPFGGSSIYAQYRIFKAVREAGISVTLEGQGADELWAGYHGYPNQRILSLLESGRWMAALRFAWNWGGWPGRSFSWAVRDFARFRAHLLNAERKAGPAFPEWVDADALLAAGVNPRLTRNPLRADASRRRVVEELATVATKRDLTKLLRDGERNSMHFSVESRLPFLTTDMADLALSMPEDYLIGANGETKRVFRAAMRGIVPDAILDRRDKIGFSTPESDWMLKARRTVKESLEMNRSVPFLRTDRMHHHFDRVCSGDVRYTPVVWRWLNFGRWYRMVFEA